MDTSKWKVVSSVTTVVTRDDVVAAFDEETVVKWERDMLLGVDRPLTRVIKTPHPVVLFVYRTLKTIKKALFK